MNKFFFLSILFIFLIFISGCVQQEDDENGDDVPIFYFGQGRGLTITNYTSTRLSLRLKESAELKINFKNIGDFEAKNIAAIIYGYGELEIISEKPHIVEILPGLEDFMFWILKAEELGSAITSYQINSRIYYDYQFEGYEQVSFIPEDHIGDAPTISRVNERSPLVLEIQSGSPIRTIFCEKNCNIETICDDGIDNDADGLIDLGVCEDESGNSIDCTLIGAIMVNGPDTDCQVDGFEDDESKHCNDGIDNDGDGLIDCFDYNCTSQCGQEFSITLVLNNEGVGDVKYKENPDKTYKLNTINIQVPDNWIETFDINGINEYSDIIPVWKKEHQAENDIIEYTLNYDEIKDLLSNNRCSIGENSSDPATICDLLYDSLQDVWLVRGEETRIQISFIRPLVKEVTIDKVSAYGDYGYVIDTRDFGKSITINVNQ